MGWKVKAAQRVGRLRERLRRGGRNETLVEGWVASCQLPVDVLEVVLSQKGVGTFQEKWGQIGRFLKYGVVFRSHAQDWASVPQGNEYICERWSEDLFPPSP